MSDDAALLAAILAHPDEDTPRLMYADWLQENGQPDRAEFIRIQCDPAADEAAEDRAISLVASVRESWRPTLPQFVGARWEFRRGFPEHLDVPAELMLERFEAFARVPWLRALTIRDMWNEHVRDLCNRRWPSQWVELELLEDDETVDFHHYDGLPAINALANCSSISQLRRLELTYFTVSEASHEVLALRERMGERLVIG